MPLDQFFSKNTNCKRQNKAKKFDRCISRNIVVKSVTNNSKPYVIPKTSTEQYKHFYFVRTVSKWNHLDNAIVTSSSVETF